MAGTVQYIQGLDDEKYQHGDQTRFQENHGFDKGNGDIVGPTGEV